MHVLLVEDDIMVAEAICDGMRLQSVVVDHAKSAGAARSALVEHQYAAVVLDIGLPGESGLSVLKFMRDRYDDTPVVMLTARSQLSDRIRGLDAGADDYLTKPFSLDELLARIRAVTRRSQGKVIPVLSHGDVSLYPSRRQVTKAGARAPLSGHEYKLLLTLMERKDQVVSRSYLEDSVYGSDASVESNTIAYFIHQLRRKLGDGIVTTVHGQGYMVGGGNE